MSPDISDYPDALDRIMSSDVRPDSTSRGEVARDLSDSGPQVTLEVAANVADAVLTDEQLREGLDGSGRLPTEQTIDSAARGLSDHSDADREQRVIESVRESVVTREDLDRAVEQPRASLPSRDDLRSDIETEIDGKDVVGVSREEAVDGAIEDVATLEDVAAEISQPRDSLPTESEIERDVQRAIGGKELPGVQESDVMREVTETVATRERVLSEIEEIPGPTYREDVGNSVDESGELPGVSREDAVEEISQELGAPSRSDVERARAQAASPDESVRPADREDLSSDSGTPINLIRDESGEAVGAFGGASQGGVSPEETAEELGVEYLGSVSEVSESIELRQERGRSELRIDGKTLQEVDV